MVTRVAGSVSESLVVGPGLLGCWLGQRPIEPVAIAALVAGDSPRLDGEDAEHVRVLAGIGDPLPPIVVHRGTMRVVDGMHRVRAAALRGDERIDARFFEGSDADAFVLSVSLNAGQGLPLKHADRVAAAIRIMNSYPEWSNRSVAAVSGLSDKTVSSLRVRSTSEISQLNSRVGRDGRVRPVDAAQGRVRASEVIAADPAVSLREIAKRSGVSLGTARDVRERMRLNQDVLPPRQRQAIGPAPPVAVPTDGSFTVALEHLKRDPALRYNEFGRAMLRLLDAHSVGFGNWARLIDSVPPYSRGVVAEAARGCAQLWLAVAQHLER